MPTVRQILATGPLSTTRQLSDNAADVNITDTVLVEDLDRLGEAEPNSVAVLTRHASADFRDHRVDVALRRGAAAGVRLLVLSDQTHHVLSRTAQQICTRYNLTVAALNSSVDLGVLCAELIHHIGGSGGDALQCLRELAATLDAFTAGENGDIAELLDYAGRTFETSFELTEGAVNPMLWSVPLEVDGMPIEWLSVEPRGGAAGHALWVALRLLDAALVQRRATSSGRATLPARSRASLIVDLLHSSSTDLTALRNSARALDLPVDGWHRAIRMELTPQNIDEQQRYVFLERAESVVNEHLTRYPNWHCALFDRALTIVHISSSEPGSRSVDSVKSLARQILDVLGHKLPMLTGRAGVGGAHRGLAGIRATTSEAVAALQYVTDAPMSSPVVVFDELGLDRMLLEWYTSATVQSSIADMLQPLDQLPQAQADELIRTLLVYLEEQGSVRRAATRLHLHRNGLSYRINRIVELLRVDLDNPDRRLSLQLACRARTLAPSRT